MARMVGAVLVAIGAVWIGQGLGYVGGSFMTGQMHWTWIGAAVALGGVVLMLVGRRR